MTLGRWIMSAATVEPSIGCWKGRQVVEAAMLTPSSRCAAAVGTSSCHLWHPCLSNSPTSSRHQHCKLIGSTNTFVNIMQLSRLHRSVLRWITASMKVEVDPQHSASTANSVTGIVPSFHVMETVLHMHNYIYTTHAKPSNIGCNETRHLTRSSWSACKLLF